MLLQKAHNNILNSGIKWVKTSNTKASLHIVQQSTK